LVLFWQCGIFCFSIYCWYCSDSVVFFVFPFIENRKTKNTTLSEQYQQQIEKQKIPHCQNTTNNK
jgi:hypothetical protein